MATDKQIEANRLNALKSTGHRTPEGKSAAARAHDRDHPGAARLACATTLTKPDPFPYPFASRLVLPAGVTTGLVAKGILHARTKGDGGVAKTTDVRWTLVLKRAS